MRVFISQPMGGLTREKIISNRNTMINKLKVLFGQDIQIIDSLLEGENQPIEALGKSVQLMSGADLIYLGKGWSKSRGCIIENMVAKYYKIATLEEE